MGRRRDAAVELVDGMNGIVCYKQRMGATYGRSGYRVVRLVEKGHTLCNYPSGLAAEHKTDINWLPTNWKLV